MIKRGLLVLLGAIAVAGCGLPGSGGNPGGGDKTGRAELRRFASNAEFVRYFRTEVVRRNDRYMDFGRGFMGEGDSVLDLPSAGGDAGAGGDAAPEGPGQAPSPDGQGGGDAGRHSGTTLQEEGVDESDVVKTDGTYIYTIDDAFEESLLRIVRVDQPEELVEIGQVELRGSGRDIYLMGDTVVALTATFGGFIYGGPGGVIEEGVEVEQGDDPSAPVPDSSPGFQRPKTIVSIVDVSDRNEPVITSTTSFEGNQVSSRMIDGVLHLVVANYPEYYFDVLPLGSAEVETVEFAVSTLLPDYQIVDEDGSETTGDVVGWRDVYHPVDVDGFGMVTVISMDAHGGGQFESVGIVAEPGLVYASTQALYLTDTEFDFLGEVRETTDVYKFALTDEGAVLTAAGQVSGRILNQYSMSEFEGALRVATTTGPSFMRMDGDESQNHVYVLEQKGKALEVIGSIENIAAGETIQSARFIGSRGFLVTFEQIDPLFTLDLSDPRHPRIVGELKVPGFSTFIVPMGENHLLTVGQYIPEEGFFGRGVQLSIFDVSDYANPRLAHLEVLGDGRAWSEAMWDPKAFTYFAARGLLALPATIYEGDPFGEPGGGGGAIPPRGEGEDPLSPPDVFEGLMVYRVSAEEGFSELGRIDTRIDDGGWYYTAFTRGVFIDDTVFAVTNSVVRGAPLDDIASAPYELLIGAR